MNIEWSESQNTLLTFLLMHREDMNAKWFLVASAQIHMRLMIVTGQKRQRLLLMCSGVVPIPTSTDLTDEQQDSDETEDMSKLWCYCNEPSFGEMMLCDNEKCTIKWYHFDCLRIRCPPKGKWYYPSCRKLSRLCKKKKA